MLGENKDEQPIPFVENIKKLLKDDGVLKVQDYCCDKENYEEVGENGWDILALLMTHLKEEKVQDEQLEIFQQIFTHIATASKPKEILLSVLEQFDPMVDLAIVQLLLPALSIACKRSVLTDKRNHCHNLGMVFSSLTYYLDGLNLPKYNNFEPMKNAEISEELKIARFVSSCTELGSILMKEIKTLFKNNEIHETHFKAVKMEFMNFCSGLLERLAYLDMDEQSSTRPDNPLCTSCSKTQESVESENLEKSERSSTVASNKLCTLMRTLSTSWEFLCIFNWNKLHRNDRKFTEEESAKIELARACYLYIVLIKQSETYSFPQVASPEFVFLRSIPSILILWKTSESVQIHKGLELCRFVTNRLKPFSLQCGAINHSLKDIAVKQPCKRLLVQAVNITVHCPSKTLRQRAAQFLIRFLDKFTWMDRYNLLYYLLTTVEHCGVLGYLIGYFKDKLAQILQDPLPPYCDYFIERTRINRILDVCLVLSDGSETDLLSEYDRLMASLNLLRFLFIRDANDVTSIWSRATLVEKKYLEPLRTGINLSRMHFRDELKKQSSTKTDDTTRPDFYINGISLPTLPPKDRRLALESAIHSFDMMETVCIRVQQLIDEKKFGSAN